MIVGEFRKNKKTDPPQVRDYLYTEVESFATSSLSLCVYRLDKKRRILQSQNNVVRCCWEHSSLLDLSWDLIMWFYVYIIDHLFRHRDHRNGASLTCRRSSAVVVVVVATELITRTQNMKLDFRAFFASPGLMCVAPYLIVVEPRDTSERTGSHKAFCSVCRSHLM